MMMKEWTFSWNSIRYNLDYLEKTPAKPKPSKIDWKKPQESGRWYGDNKENWTYEYINKTYKQNEISRSTWRHLNVLNWNISIWK